MSREQAAQFLGYSIRTLCNLAVLRQGPPFYSSRRKVWYLKSEILAWLKSQRQGGKVIA